MASRESEIRSLPHETLIIHGRDDKVIPLSNSLTLLEWIDRSQLHVFSRCGHWVQIEHSQRFSQLLAGFFAETKS
jgi:2-hydroxymuconate-semialdehyde hydrolase